MGQPLISLPLIRSSFVKMSQVIGHHSSREGLDKESFPLVFG
jgi:hypothetical protein